MRAWMAGVLAAGIGVMPATGVAAVRGYEGHEFAQASFRVSVTIVAACETSFGSNTATITCSRGLDYGLRVRNGQLAVVEGAPALDEVALYDEGADDRTLPYRISESDATDQIGNPVRMYAFEPIVRMPRSPADIFVALGPRNPIVIGLDS